MFPSPPNAFALDNVHLTPSFSHLRIKNKVYFTQGMERLALGVETSIRNAEINFTGLFQMWIAFKKVNLPLNSTRRPVFCVAFLSSSLDPLGLETSPLRPQAPHLWNEQELSVSYPCCSKHGSGTSSACTIMEVVRNTQESQVLPQNY